MNRWYAVPTLAALAFAAACDDTSRGPTAVDPSTGPSFAHVAPERFDGNLTCKNLLTDAAYEIKIDPPKTGSYGPLTVTFSNGGKTVGFTSTVAVMGVFVKGGNEGGNFYDYRTLNPQRTKADEDLVVPTNQQISHVSFCWNSESDVTNPPPPPPTGGGPPVLVPLTVTKTAAGTYDRTITWGLAKTVDVAAHSGLAGQTVGSSIWTVVGTRSEPLSGFRVTGNITITNTNGIDVDFSVDDVMDDRTVATVTCPVFRVPAKNGETNGSVICSYVAEPQNASSKLNSVLVTSTTEGVAGNGAMAEITWEANVLGSGSATLADANFNYLESITSTTTKTFPQTFVCPSNRSAYDANRSRQSLETNIATLTVNGVATPASATVTVNCTYPWADETATGAGKKYPGSSNWFMYTGYTTSKVDLIAGQNRDAGDIFMSRTSTHTVIQIVMQNGFRWADVKDNLKIQDFDSEPKAYVEPGSFKHKFEISGNTVTVTIPGTKAKFYGIHGDTERPL